MSQPIYVDASDEVTTVIEKLKAAEGSDISLVVPKGALLLQSIVNLKLVKRAAKESSKELTIITTDTIGRNLAAQVGLANLAHLDREDAEEIGGIKVNYYDPEVEPAIPIETAPLPEPIIPVLVTPKSEPTVDASPISVKEEAPEEESRNIPSEVAVVTPLLMRSRRRFGFLLYLLLLFLVAGATLAAYYYPVTDIRIRVAGSPWSKSYPITLIAGQPGAAFLQADVADTYTFKATGTRDIGNQAHGTATLSYVQDSTPVTIAAGTKLTANNIDFTTDQAVTIPGAKVVNAVPVAGSTKVALTALVAGATGNLNNAPATVTSPYNVYGQIDQTSGGTTKQVAVVTQTDIANAKQSLSDQLHTKATEQMKGVVSGTITATHTPTDDPTKSESFVFTPTSFDPPAGTQADGGTFKGAATLRRLAYDFQFAETSAKAMATKDAPLTGTLQIGSTSSSVVTSDFKTGTINVTETVVGQVLPHIDSSFIANQATGKSFSSVRTLIEGVVPNATATINKRPTWWPFERFPFNIKRITVSVTGI